MRTKSKLTVVLSLGIAMMCLPLVRAAGDADWDAFETAQKELRELERELRSIRSALDVCREGVAARNASKLADARKAVEDAENELEAELSKGEIAAAHKRLQAARAVRDEKAGNLVADFPAFRAARERQAELEKKIEALEARIAKLSADEAMDLAKMRGEKRGLDRHLYGSIKSLWTRGEVRAAFQKADEAYKANGAVSGKSQALKQANGKLKQARRALDAAIAALPLEGKAAEVLNTRRQELEDKISKQKARVAPLEKSLVGGKTVSISRKAYDRRKKKEVNKQISLWLPSNHEYIRGVIMAHSMVKSLATSRTIRLVAAREGLATMVADNLVFKGPDSWATVDGVLADLAEASGHPELKGAPLVVGGLSASVLATRNLACVKPERIFGVVHVAGGNLQEMPEGGAGMVEVPFLAHNGEFEWCGPVGGGHSSGRFGIRPEYGNQTQWVMIREQMLRLWRDKHRHRMSLVVVPNADHGAWDVGLTALFIRKAVKYRLPKEKRDGSKPAVCRPLPVKQGWLTDADLDHPKFEPAPYNEYKGDKNNTFWHFDGEMARAVYKYHKDRFILPDPTKASPVPDDWPPKKK